MADNTQNTDNHSMSKETGDRDRLDYGDETARAPERNAPYDDASSPRDVPFFSHENRVGPTSSIPQQMPQDMGDQSNFRSRYDSTYADDGRYEQQAARPAQDSYDYTDGRSQYDPSDRGPDPQQYANEAPRERRAPEDYDTAPRRPQPQDWYDQPRGSQEQRRERDPRDADMQADTPASGHGDHKNMKPTMAQTEDRYVPAEETQEIPSDFGFEDEHPQLTMPFTLKINGEKYKGESISLTHLYVKGRPPEDGEYGKKQLALLQIAFDNFLVTLEPEVALRHVGRDGMMTFQFTNPTGDHLPQLRYILNSMISGDFVSIDGMVSYSGQTEPSKNGKANGENRSVKDRVRSIAVAVVSFGLILAAAGMLYSRSTTGHELHPVFIEPAGQAMRATSAGQIAYLNPEAKKGEVVYSINSNRGDVLSFQMPCDCDYSITGGIGEGATVLPEDLILTIFDNSVGIRAQTLISIDGLSRAMNGDNLYMDVSDGRTIPAKVVVNEATSTATMRGELYVPVILEAENGALTEDDIGKSATVRLTKSLVGSIGLKQEGSE